MVRDRATGPLGHRVNACQRKVGLMHEPPTSRDGRYKAHFAAFLVSIRRIIAVTSRNSKIGNQQILDILETYHIRL